MKTWPEGIIENYAFGVLVIPSVVFANNLRVSIHLNFREKEFPVYASEKSGRASDRCSFTASF